MSQLDPATKQDLVNAINELKLYVVEREIAWLKWIVGIQISYLVITVSVAFVMGRFK